jgi:predicted transcriptional regulator
MDQQNQLNDVKTDVELLKKDVSNIQNLLSRLDTAIDKIADATGGISKILAVHDSAIDSCKGETEDIIRRMEKDNDLIHARISDMKDESEENRRRNHEAVMSKLDTMVVHGLSVSSLPL